jgi:hypothetical protein
MPKIAAKLWNGRKIKEEKTFDVPGTFESMYAAERWLSENGYKTGSSCREEPIAIQKGQYTLPQKWKNFTKADKAMIDGVMITSFREGPCKVIIFEDKTVL